MSSRVRGAEDGKRRIQASNLGRDRPGQRGRVAVRARQKRHRREDGVASQLIHGHVQHRQVRVRQRQEERVRADAHDGRVGLAIADAPADRFFAGPEPSGGRLVHDDRAHVVGGHLGGILKLAPADDRVSERAEVARAHGGDFRELRPRGFAIRREGFAVAVAGERQQACPGRRPHSRQRRDARAEVRGEPVRAGGVVARQARARPRRSRHRAPGSPGRSPGRAGGCGGRDLPSRAARGTGRPGMRRGRRRDGRAPRPRTSVA